MNESEVKVIEAILHNNSKYDELGLRVDDFTDRDNRKVYEAISKLIESGVTADQDSVHSAGIEYGTIFKYEPFFSANADFYARKVKDATKMRGFKRLGLMIQDGVRTQDPEQLAETIEKEFYKVSERVSTTLPGVADALFEAMDELEKLHRDGSTELPTGFGDLDKMISGFPKSSLVVIAARTSIGKTAFAINIATNMAWKGHPVCFFSCEMPRTAIVRRMISSIGMVDHSVLTSFISKDDMTRISDANSKIHELPMYIDDTPNIHYTNLVAKCRMAKRLGCKCIFIDYLTLVGYGDAKTPRWERVGELVKNLKHLSRLADIPIVVMSQLNRNAEGTQPSLAELRQSGEIEEHADMIIFLHRERGNPSTECIVAKNRSGPTGKVELYFDDRHTRFTGVEQ
jgi:replicative DNA helicase